MSGRLVVYMHRLSAVVLLFCLVPPSMGTAGEPERQTHGKTFDWQNAASQSLFFLGMEHGFRLTQAKTRHELKGPFFPDWKESVAGVQGWGDGDTVFTNYIAHPMQGGVAGFIQIQNDAHGRSAEFSRSKTYWNSRLRALGWAALYSTQFELGPISEATIGNVGNEERDIRLCGSGRHANRWIGDDRSGRYPRQVRLEELGTAYRWYSEAQAI